MALQPTPNQTQTRKQLLFAADALFADLECSTSPLILLSHFSTTHPVFFDHAPNNSYPSPLIGLNAVRSYFDLIATHWTRYDLLRHSTRVCLDTREVVVRASLTWKWRKSGSSWREDFTCTLGYDEHLKVKSFVVKTESGPGTCVMRAVDRGAQVSL